MSPLEPAHEVSTLFTESLSSTGTSSNLLFLIFSLSWAFPIIHTESRWAWLGNKNQSSYYAFSVIHSNGWYQVWNPDAYSTAFLAGHLIPCLLLSLDHSAFSCYPQSCVVWKLDWTNAQPALPTLACGSWESMQPLWMLCGSFPYPGDELPSTEFRAVTLHSKPGAA